MLPLEPLSPTVTEIPPPADIVFRVGHRNGPFSPTPWKRIRRRDPRIAGKDDGRIGGRFDDPAGCHGYPEARRFRTIYFSSQRAGAFVEALGPLQVPIDRLADGSRKRRLPRGLENVRNAEALEDVDADIVDPEDPAFGIVPEEWMSNRRVATARFDRSLRFVDLTSAETVQHVRDVHAKLARRLKLRDVDYGTLMGPERHFTQAVASYFFEVMDDSRDAPAYDGIYYRSRFDPDWECWALFERARQSINQVSVDDIVSKDRDLAMAASVLRLSIVPGR